jgi:hypothetical protein
MGFLHARKLRKAREDRELAALKGPSQERQETEEEVHARVRLEEPIMASWEQGPSVEKLADSLEQAASDLESIGRAREDLSGLGDRGHDEPAPVFDERSERAGEVGGSSREQPVRQRGPGDVQAPDQAVLDDLAEHRQTIIAHLENMRQRIIDDPLLSQEDRDTLLAKIQRKLNDARGLTS